MYREPSKLVLPIRPANAKVIPATITGEGTASAATYPSHGAGPPRTRARLNIQARPNHRTDPDSFKHG
jgi:hypothetical protein